MLVAWKKKYGVNAFKKWGNEGGSPILKAAAEDRITIHEKPVKKKRARKK